MRRLREIAEDRLARWLAAITACSLLVAVAPDVVAWVWALCLLIFVAVVLSAIWRWAWRRL